MAPIVIFNPQAGRGMAANRLRQLLPSHGGQWALCPTSVPGEAERIAYDYAMDGMVDIVAAGGDGTVHEVANGILRANRTETVLTIIPVGSANDYYHSLFGKEKPQNGLDYHTVDVGLVSAPMQQDRYFFCCLGMGFNGAVTLESRQIRRLQGTALYLLATLRALYARYALPRTVIQFDDSDTHDGPTLMMSVLIAKREGSFTMAPHAILDDGKFDIVLAGALSRWQVLKLLPRLAVAGPPTNAPNVHQRRCERVRVQCEHPLIVHIDGEFFCRPEDKVHEMEIRILPRCLKVKPFAAHAQNVESRER